MELQSRWLAFHARLLETMTSASPGNPQQKTQMMDTITSEGQDTPEASERKHVYRFGAGAADGGAGMRNLLGGKGANLAEMASLGLPVPPGFTVTTDVCTAYFANDHQFPAGLKEEVEDALNFVGEAVGARFGDLQNPLLVSVRSGARVSMPGMMDTVLNLGLNDETVEGLARKADDRRFAFDSYRRFIQMYSDVVLGLDHHLFEQALEQYKNLNAMELDTELSAEDWAQLVERYKQIVQDKLGRPFPQDIHEQLWGAIGAVFESWHTARAVTYRRLHGIPEDWGTAVNVQAMVFGNTGDSSATGVAFTRNPSTGENSLYGEFLVNAQGEDVVAGIRTPQYISEAARVASGDERPSLETVMPGAFAELREICLKLERNYRDMQDIEFTIQDGKLWMLQTRSGKRTTKASLKIATDLTAEGLITKEEALLRIDPEQLDQLLHPMLDPNAHKDVLTTGLPASPGAATGELVFTPDEAETLRNLGKPVILARIETSPEDIHGMHAAAGILTARGGMTSHAAVVARGMGRPCVSGAKDLSIDYEGHKMTAGGRTLHRGDVITIDGGTGEVIAGEVPTLQPELGADFQQLMDHADEVRRMKVRANAETPRDAKQAREFGAEGIGLCRTEHMFFEGERTTAMREMIVADDEAGRRAALAKILPMQRQDFLELFEIMAGLPLTIRLLDPPLHEFLPHEDADIRETAEKLGISDEKLRTRLAQLKEFNPMLGHRGCRLAVSYPEIPEMQARAIFEAATEAGQRTGAPVVPEVMVPLVGLADEFNQIKARIDATAEQVARETGVKLDYQVGTMIEIPRAALRAREIAKSAEFFSFGTNDLTQMTYGLSRDDSGSFLGDYMSHGIMSADPFVTLDTDGVGELVQIASERGRATRADLKLGICGEHGGDAASIAFCESVGLDYVSCSPYRVPVARLAAAQAALRAHQAKS
jgi:pyruvate,orthophosphate dikinase